MPLELLSASICLSVIYLVLCCVQSLSRVQLFATLWTIARQAPLSMEFSRQEYWSELPFPSPGALPDTGIKPKSPALQADSLQSEPPGKPLSLKIFQLFVMIHTVRGFSTISEAEVDVSLAFSMNQPMLAI